MLARAPALSEWMRKVASCHYDPRDVPPEQKAALTIGMGMTEKQGGSDVRANTTRAFPLAAGGPGEAMVPLRYALVKEGIEPKTIWSKLYMLPVQVPPGQPHVPFTHVVEDMAVPVPPAAA